MTRLFGVMGCPISHSLSPVMHTAAFRALHLDALYTSFEVGPRSLSPVLRGLIRAGVNGLNVTVPLKEAIVPYMDHLGPTARELGAVNTIVIRHGRTTGHNTDGVGFVRALTELGWRPRRARVLILGAGGAARSVCWELSRVAGSRLVIANRHLERAQRLRRWLSQRRPDTAVQAVSLGGVSRDEVDLLVNATPVGMRPGDRLPVDPALLRPGVFVYDLVYNRETALVRVARRRGCVAAVGLSMLLYQAAASLRVWLHRAPPLGAMRRALHGAIRRSGRSTG